MRFKSICAGRLLQGCQFRLFLLIFSFALFANQALAQCSIGYCLPRDSHGFTILTPSADSLVVYVSESQGNDQNNCSYLKSELIGDVFNPSGTTRGPLAPCKTLDRGYSFLRNLKPDYLLLKKGDTWRGESINVGGGGGGHSLQGRSASEPIVFSSYGVGARPMFYGGSFQFGGNIASPGYNLIEVNNIVLKGLQFRPDFSKPRGLRGGAIGASDCRALSDGVAPVV